MTIQWIICDIDGTLANIDHRKHLVEEKKWPEFYKACVNDVEIKPIRIMLQTFPISEADIELAFITGRPESIRKETEEWLRANNFFNYELYMRKDKDYRKDSVYKQEVYNKYFKDKREVLFAIEDRKQVVDMWRSNGLMCLQCAEGNF